MLYRLCKLYAERIYRRMRGFTEGCSRTVQSAQKCHQCFILDLNVLLRILKFTLSTSRWTMTTWAIADALCAASADGASAGVASGTSTETSDSESTELVTPELLRTLSLRIRQRRSPVIMSSFHPAPRSTKPSTAVEVLKLLGHK